MHHTLVYYYSSWLVCKFDYEADGNADVIHILESTCMCTLSCIHAVKVL